MIEIRAPNGEIVQFPDGTADDVMAGAMAQAYGGPKAMDARGANAHYDAAGVPQDAGAVALDALKQTGVETGRAGLAALGLPGDIRSLGLWLARKAGASPATVTKAEEGMRQAGPFITGPGGLIFSGPNTQTIENKVSEVTGPFRKAETPTGETIGNVGGFAAGLLTPGGPLRKAVGVVAPWLGSEAGGAVAGDPGRIAGALLGAPVASIRSGAQAGQKASQVLRSEAKPGYATFDQEASNIIVSQPSFKGAVDDMANDMLRLKLDPGTHPNSSALFSRLQADAAPPASTFKMQGLASAGAETAAPTNISLDGLEILRRNAVGIASRAQLPADREAARVIADKLDDYMARLDTKDLVSAGGMTPAEALAAKQAADVRWSQMRKTERVEQMLERVENKSARFSQSGKENALREEFRTEGNAERTRIKNGKARKWTDAELEAIEKVGRGGTFSNLMRDLGAYFPKRPVAAAATNIVGNAIGGPMVAGALAAAGAVGRAAATSGAQRRAERVLDLVSGSVVPRQPRQFPISPNLLLRSYLLGQGAAN